MPAVLLLAPELVEHIFSYLDFRSLVQCESVCKYWRLLARSDTLWRRHLANIWLVPGVAIDDDVLDYRELFVSKFLQYGSYVDCYKQIRTAWNTIERVIVEKKVQIQLASGLSDAQMDDLQRTMFSGRQLPNDLRCYLRLHDGDAIATVKDNPMWKVVVGEDDFLRLRQMESFVSLLKAPTEDMIYIGQAGLCPFTVSYTFINTDLLLSRNAKCVALHDNQLGLPCGAIVSVPLYVTSLDGLREVRILARSFSEWFVRYAQELAEHRYPVHSGQISGFRYEPQLFTQTRLGAQHSVLTVQVGLLHVPDFRSITNSKEAMLLAMDISINSDADKRDECCLESRSFCNYDSRGRQLRKTENEPVTVGRNVCFGPGKHFTYPSMNVIVDDGGSVSGHFTFRRLRDGVAVKVELPTIEYQLAPRTPVLRSVLNDLE